MIISSCRVLLSMEKFFFYLFSACAIISALAVIIKKDPVISAIFLIGNLFSLACLFVLLEAHFVAAIQILVYAGAVMVLFTFIIMLLNLPAESLPKVKLNSYKILAIIIAMMFLVLISRELLPIKWRLVPTLSDFGSINNIAEPLFREYALAFELTSIILLIGIVGAIILSKRKI